MRNDVWKTLCRKDEYVNQLTKYYIWKTDRLQAACMRYVVCLTKRLKSLNRIKPRFFNGWWLKNQLLENTPFHQITEALQRVDCTPHTHMKSYIYGIVSNSTVNLLIHGAESMVINLTFMKFIIMWMVMWKYSKYEASRFTREFSGKKECIPSQQSFYSV